MKQVLFYVNLMKYYIKKLSKRDKIYCDPTVVERKLQEIEAYLEFCLAEKEKSVN